MNKEDFNIYKERLAAAVQEFSHKSLDELNEEQMCMLVNHEFVRLHFYRLTPYTDVGGHAIWGKVYVGRATNDPVPVTKELIQRLQKLPSNAEYMSVCDAIDNL